MLHFHSLRKTPVEMCHGDQTMCDATNKSVYLKWNYLSHFILFIIISYWWTIYYNMITKSEFSQSCMLIQHRQYSIFECNNIHNLKHLMLKTCNLFKTSVGNAASQLVGIKLFPQCVWDYVFLAGQHVWNRLIPPLPIKNGGNNNNLWKR